MPWLRPGGSLAATSFYDTEHLKHTLESLVDFDRPNAGMTRFSAGAVNVRTGNLVYFDIHTIAPEHVMVSGALPPGLSRDRDRWRALLVRRPLCPTRHCSGVIESNLDWSSVLAPFNCRGADNVPRSKHVESNLLRP
jgi:hypothetical protein